MNQSIFFSQQQQKSLIQLGSTLAEAYLNGFQLMSTYCSVYSRVFDEIVQENDKIFRSTSSNRWIISLYEEWIKLTSKELQKVLKSDQFLSLLSKYTESLVNLHSAYRMAGYPIDYFDRLVDYYKQIARIALSISKEFNLAPHDVVYKRGKTRLLHYLQDVHKKRSNGSRGQSQPLLIVYAPINQFHILDLDSDISVVRNLLSNDLDVYMIDWGYLGLDDSELKLDDYIDYIHESVKIIQQQTGTQKVSILGYCWGGVFALIYTALHNDNMRNLTLMATPIDLAKDETILGAWSRAVNIDSVMDEFGQMDGQALDIIFLMRNPLRYGFDKYLKFFGKLQDKEFVSTFIDTERWLYDTPPIPEALHRKIINDCYKNNLLASNEMRLDDRGKEKGQKIDLRKVTVPLLTIVAERDDIVSLESALAVNYCVSSKDKTTLKNPGGHVALCISNEAHQRLWPQVAKWILSS